MVNNTGADDNSAKKYNHKRKYLRRRKEDCNHLINLIKQPDLISFYSL